MARKPWVTDEMVDKIHQRRKFKMMNTETGKQQYKKLSNELRRATDAAREKWWTEQCTELEI